MSHLEVPKKFQSLNKPKWTAPEKDTQGRLQPSTGMHARTHAICAYRCQTCIHLYTCMSTYTQTHTERRKSIDFPSQKESRGEERRNQAVKSLGEQQRIWKYMNVWINSSAFSWSQMGTSEAPSSVTWSWRYSHWQTLAPIRFPFLSRAVAVSLPNAATLTQLLMLQELQLQS